MNGSPVAPPDPSGNDEEVVLRLGDVLRLIPAQFLKPGEHDRMRPIRLSVDELAQQISRGRVSIPLTRLAAVCPDIFEAPDEVPPEEELALPLQRLLDQIGLVAKRSALQNNIPKAQVEQAREEAGRLLSAAAAETPPERTEPIPPFAVAKALSAAKQFLGFFGRQSENAPLEAPEKPAAAEKPATPPEPMAPPPTPDGFIALRLKPIFQLLPSEVVDPGFSPPVEARAIFPLSLIDPQLAAGHVEVQLEELSKALPEKLRGHLRPVEGVQVWIPLDEIFQSLPPAHLYYMPPLDSAPEPAAEELSAKVEPEPEKPASEEAEAIEEEPAPAAAEAPQEKQEEPIQEAKPEEPLPVEEVPAAEEKAGQDEPAPEPSPEKESIPEPPVAPSPEEKKAAPAEPPAEPKTSTRAPWMRGFMVPPPQLLAQGGVAATHPAETPMENPVAKTPEAKQTADFLAGQPGIFAAAAFVEGAIFASADFPRKPDLETLRDVIGAFVEKGQESARRLGWNGVLTLACENFFVTAVVRENHFIVALHHDRVLPPVAHEALLGAAEEFGKAVPEKP